MRLLSASLLLLSASFATAADSSTGVSGLRRAQVAEIVGGTVADLNDFPYFIKLTQGCGATLVHEDIGVSAAHCYQSQFTAIVGPDQVSTQVGKKVVHPGYNDYTIQNDYMVFKLVSSSFPNIQLPTINADSGTPAPDGADDLVVVGYGATSEDGSQSYQFREVTVQHVPISDCNSAVSYDGAVDEASMFCAGVEGGGKDSCQGDSGGPILMGNTLVGMTSWGFGCARDQYPGVYSRISAASSWIDNWICCLSDNPPSGCTCDQDGGNDDGGNDDGGNDDGGNDDGDGGGDNGGSDGGDLCYSGDNLVQVQNKGYVLMSKLQIGDRVLTSQDGYEPVYAFGHRQETLKTTFLKLRVASGKWIELTGAHLIHVHGKTNPVRADSIQVGDSLVGHSGENLTVIKIQEVTKKGIYAPLTTSGKIVVNGMVASSYVSLQENATEYVQLGATKIMVSQASISHWWMSPLRMLCTSSYPSLEICKMVDDKGISPWVSLGFRYAKWAENQNFFIQLILLATTLLGLAIFNVVEAAINSPRLTLTFASLIALVLNRSTIQVHAIVRFSSDSKQKVV